MNFFRCSSLKNGATDRIRTYDPLITNEMLYQLSYSSIEQENYIISTGIVQGGKGTWVTNRDP